MQFSFTKATPASGAHRKGKLFPERPWYQRMVSLRIQWCKTGCIMHAFNNNATVFMLKSFNLCITRHEHCYKISDSALLTFRMVLKQHISYLILINVLEFLVFRAVPHTYALLMLKSSLIKSPLISFLFFVSVHPVLKQFKDSNSANSMLFIKWRKLRNKRGKYQSFKRNLVNKQCSLHKATIHTKISQRGWFWQSQRLAY